MSDDPRQIVNAATAERIRFLRTADDTGGELLEMEDIWPNSAHAVPEHVHPAIEERWEVLEGRVAFRIDGEERILGRGETIAAAPGVRHSSRNAGDGQVRLRIEMRPALRWEEFVRRLFAAPEVADSERRVAELLIEFADEIALPGA